MLSHFTLTLELTDNELLLLTCIAEYFYDRDAGLAAGSASALARLNAQPPYKQLIERLSSYYPGSRPGWDIAETAGAKVTLRTGAQGSCLATLIRLLSQFVPGCLAHAIHYRPIRPASLREHGNAVH